MSVLANLRRRVRICFAWQQMKAEWFVTVISDYLYVAVGVHSTLQCPEETGAESKVSAHKGHPALADGENGCPSELDGLRRTETV